MAKAHPKLLRRAYAEGHIATHSQHHRVLGQHASATDVGWDFESGVDMFAAALGDRKRVAPFYHLPSLGRSTALEQHLASHGVMAWTADFEGDDWKHISADQICSPGLNARAGASSCCMTFSRRPLGRCQSYCANYRRAISTSCM